MHSSDIAMEKSGAILLSLIVTLIYQCYKYIYQKLCAFTRFTYVKGEDVAS